MDLSAFSENINSALSFGHCSVFSQLASTNLTAKELAANGALEGEVIVALSQTAGRGRLGRSFFSPDGGIYMSIILRPAFSPQKSLFITAAAAVAVSRAIEELSGRDCLIKWVNDIYISDRKVCGILTEGAVLQSGELDYAVLGIGINLTVPIGGFPEDIADRAGAVFAEKHCDEAKKVELIALCINKFFEIYSDIENSDFINEYRARSYLDGKTVTYLKDGVAHEALVLGVDENAGLRVLSDGGEAVLSAGEVTIQGSGDARHRQ